MLRVLRPYVTGSRDAKRTGTPCLAWIRHRRRLGYGASAARKTALRWTTYCLRYTGKCRDL